MIVGYYDEAKERLLKELTDQKKRVGIKDQIWKDVIGCDGECPFCGARCEEDIQCEREGANRKNHNTRFHRPMAFKGTNEKEVIDGVKVKRLLNDHCLSNGNLKHSVWRDGSKIDASKFDMLEKLNASVKTNGINVTLEWRTGNDLDIHVKCGCGKWTDTPYNIKCVKCDMARDIDMRSGRNNRKAVEHISFG